MKIRVRNFQSIADADLQLDGFVVITGGSNVGKTALIRSIEAAFFGLPGDYYVRNNESQCGVRIVDPEFDIEWRKVPTKKKKPGLETSLKVNGVLHTKIGRDHAKLTEVAGFTEIQVTGTRIRPQIAKQHDPIFLITENESAVAEIFKMLGRADVVTSAQQMARSDLKSADQETKVREKDRDRYLEEGAALNWVVDRRQEYNSVKANFDTTADSIKYKQATLDVIKAYSNIPPELIVPDLPALTLDQSKFGTLDLLYTYQDLKSEEDIVIPNEPSIPTDPREQLALIDRVTRFEKSKREDIQGEVDLNGLTLRLNVDLAAKECMEKELKICPTCERPFDGH